MTKNYFNECSSSNLSHSQSHCRYYLQYLQVHKTRIDVIQNLLGFSLRTPGCRCVLTLVTHSFTVGWGSNSSMLSPFVQIVIKSVVKLVSSPALSLDFIRFIREKPRSHEAVFVNSNMTIEINLIIEVNLLSSIRIFDQKLNCRSCSGILLHTNSFNLSHWSFISSWIVSGKASQSDPKFVPALRYRMQQQYYAKCLGLAN